MVITLTISHELREKLHKLVSHGQAQTYEELLEAMLDAYLGENPEACEILRENE